VQIIRRRTAPRTSPATPPEKTRRRCEDNPDEPPPTTHRRRRTLGLDAQGGAGRIFGSRRARRQRLVAQRNAAFAWYTNR